MPLLARMTNIGLAVTLAAGPGVPAFAGAGQDHFRNAIELQFDGEIDAAAGEYRKGLAAEPDNVSAYAQLGRLLLQDKGDIDGAISELVTALSLDPNCAVCQSLLDDALETRNSTAADQIGRGNTFYASGDLRRAVASYRAAIYIDPQNAEAHNSLAWTLYRCGSLDEGLREVREALRLKKDDPEFINTAGCLLFDKGDVAGAAENFRKAISLSGTPNPADLYGLAAVAATRGDTAGAARYFLDALKIDPNYRDLDYLRDRVGLSAKTLAAHQQLVVLSSRK